MLSRLRQIATTTLWKYADDTPAARLYRHYRVAKPVVYTWMTASVTMASALADFMFSSKGIWREAAMIVALVATGVAFFSTIPAILCIAWADEIEKALSRQGCPRAGKEPLGLLSAKFAIKMCFWFIVLVLGVHLFK